MDWDARTELQRDDQRNAWIDKMADTFEQDSDKLEAWVSSFRAGIPCHFQRGKYKAGAFNFILAFEFDDGTKWAARLTIPGRSMNPDAKILSEVATMELVRRRTRIPVPAVHGYGTESENPLGLGAFIIMDYIEGVTLWNVWLQLNSYGNEILRDDIPESDLRQVYRQMSGMLLDLQDVHLDGIGSLTFSPDGTIAANAPPLTLCTQELEHHTGLRMDPPGRPGQLLRSTTDYFNYIISQQFFQLDHQLNSVDDEGDAREKFVNHQQLKAAIPMFVDRSTDRSSTRLVCDDMRLWNILVRSAEDLTIVAVLDWEWSYAAPFQVFCSPPRWLLGKPMISKNGDTYAQLLDLFLEEMRHVEDSQSENRLVNESVNHPPGPRLSELMRRSFDDGKFWFHELMLSNFIGATNEPWSRLLRQYDHLRDVQPDEAEIEAFVARKMKDKEEYDADWARILAERRAEKAAKESDDEDGIDHHTGTDQDVQDESGESEKTDLDTEIVGTPDTEIVGTPDTEVVGTPDTEVEWSMRKTEDSDLEELIDSRLRI